VMDCILKIFFSETPGHLIEIRTQTSYLILIQTPTRIMMSTEWFLSLMVVGIRCADHATPAARKGWH
jgi:hypothetical protein